jgi:ABC-2 type transport system permease protein
MIVRIARKELLEMSRDGRFRVLAAMVLAVSIVSLAAGWKHYADVNRQHEAAQAATRHQWLSQPPKNPHSAAHYGVYAFKPRTQLAVIDTGIDPYVGVASWLEAHRQNEFKYRPAQDRTALQRFGEMTAAEALQVLMPLVIVLMTFGAFAGEREQGTLRQLLSLGVSRRALSAGKALGIAAALGLMLVPATAMGIGALALTSPGGTLLDNWSRPALMVATYAAYFGVITAVCLAVSARAQSSRLALVVLLGFWFVNSLVASRLASDIAGWLYPTPSAIEFQTAIEVELTDPREVQERLEKRKQELFARYSVDSVDALPIAFSGISLQEGEERANEVFDHHYGRLFVLYEQQNRVGAIGGLAAPMLSVRSLSMGLAGTDFAHHQHFVASAEAYRRQIQRVMNHAIAANQKPGQVYLAGQELWGQVPEFDYAPPPTAWVLRHHIWSVVILGAWLIAALAVLSRVSVTAPVD